jgi:8-oxo-dGTP pyrophosphatase MutT (NUDIX family)
MEILFIERAAHPEDPWSGNLGFPGGKVETGDGSERQTAERETCEEIGLDLEKAKYLGRIPDIIGAHLPVRISCFVYGLVRPAHLVLEDEVKSAFWFPLDQLQNPDRHLAATVNFYGLEITSPAIQILAPGQTVLWGITYRLVISLIEILAGSGLISSITISPE